MLTSMIDFANKTLNALHITEFTDKIPNLDIWLLVIGAFFSLLCCIQGYRLRNLWFAGICVIFGCLVGSWIESKGFLDLNWTIVAALFATVLFVFSYRLSIPELAFVISFYMLVVQMKLPILTALIPCILLVAAVMFLQRWITTILTAVFGAWALLACLSGLSEPVTGLLPASARLFSALEAKESAYFIILTALSVFGFLFQAGLFGNDPLFRFHRKR